MATPRLDARGKVSADSNRRVASRNKAYAEAWTDPGGMEPAVVCMVIDISYTGAKLAFNPGARVPDSFVLHTGYTKRAATVVWRKENQVGVEFDLRRRTDVDPNAFEIGPPPGVEERRQPQEDVEPVSKRPKN